MQSDDRNDCLNFEVCAYVNNFGKWCDVVKLGIWAWRKLHMCFVHVVALANRKSLSELTALPYGGIVSEEYIYKEMF